MRRTSLSVLTSLFFLFSLVFLSLPYATAGGADEHFEFRQTGGAGAAIPQGGPDSMLTGAAKGLSFDASGASVTDAEPNWTEEKSSVRTKKRRGANKGRWWLPTGPSPEDEDAFQKRFTWWPTDATPSPVKDLERGGYWWWPTTPGEARPWGNRGHIYVRKIIFDYKEVPTTSQEQLKPSLVVKKILKNVKLYFDFDKAQIRDDALPVLKHALRLLKKNPEADILITGHADTRGSEKYNLQLAERRAKAIEQYMLSNDVSPQRIRILSRGKLDAVAPVTDIVGMQKDRRAQFMVAEVVEIMIPESQRYLYEDASTTSSTATPATASGPVPGTIIEPEPEIEELASEIRAGFREYTIQEGDTLGALAKEVYGKAHKWEYIYNFNRDTIQNPHKLRVGTVIRIPEE